MSTLKATLPAHTVRAATAIKRPLVVGPRALLSILFGWVALLTVAFVIGLNVA